MSISAINARNQFRGTIIEIVEGPVVSEVDVRTAAGIVTATITTRSIKQLKLGVGSEVLALVKSSDVVIATLRDPGAPQTPAPSGSQTAHDRPHPLPQSATCSV